MSRFGDLNEVRLMGKLGGDPEITLVGSKPDRANFTLATERPKKSEGGYQGIVTWHKIVAWGKNAEFCQNYLKKGSKVFISGRIDNHTYERDGRKIFVHKVVAENVQILDRVTKGGKSAPVADHEDVPL